MIAGTRTIFKPTARTWAARCRRAVSPAPENPREDGNFAGPGGLFPARSCHHSRSLPVCGARFFARSPPFPKQPEGSFAAPRTQVQRPCHPFHGRHHHRLLGPGPLEARTVRLGGPTCGPAAGGDHVRHGHDLALGRFQPCFLRPRDIVLGLAAQFSMPLLAFLLCRLFRLPPIWPWASFWWAPRRAARPPMY